MLAGVRTPRLVVFAAAVATALTGWNNLVVALLPAGWYVAANLAAAAVLLAAARGLGLSWRELGLAREHLAAGARWGGAALALVAAGYLLLLAVPATRPLLADARVAGLDAGAVAYRALVRIPLGTVLWEEVAFRGVLLAALARVLPLRSAVAASAAAFGVWHARPTAQALAVNGLVDGILDTALGVLLGCAFTAAAGVLFAWLRLRSGSLVAPALFHVATNSLGLLAAAVTT